LLKWCRAGSSILTVLPLKRGKRGHMSVKGAVRACWGSRAGLPSCVGGGRAGFVWLGNSF
jgi:hypothetical protein